MISAFPRLPRCLQLVRVCALIAEYLGQRREVGNTHAVPIRVVGFAQGLALQMCLCSFLKSRI